ncbi:MAG: hypothetical protein ACTSPH_13550 [Promethearchaeota archaeon]
MIVDLYVVGVLLAVFSGILHYSGMLIEKIIINKVPKELQLIKRLIKTPLWFLALFMRFGLGTLFYLIAQIFIGPAIIPGLMASGLIVFTIGSVKIIGEKLNLMEVISILMIIFAITLLGFSKLKIEILNVNFFELGFITRITIFSICIFSICIVFYGLQKRIQRFGGILLSIISGLMFSLSNFWIGPLMGVFPIIFSTFINLQVLILFIIACSILVLTNILAIFSMALGLRQENASSLIPIQTIPIQIMPSFVYFFVFFLEPLNLISVIFFMAAIILNIMSSLVLDKREASLKDIESLIE